MKGFPEVEPVALLIFLAPDLYLVLPVALLGSSEMDFVMLEEVPKVEMRQHFLIQALYIVRMMLEKMVAEILMETVDLPS